MMAPIHHHFEKKDGLSHHSNQILDNSYNSGFNWTCNIKVKIMCEKLNLKTRVLLSTV